MEGNHKGERERERERDGGSQEGRARGCARHSWRGNTANHAGLTWGCWFERIKVSKRMECQTVP
eukprot:417236-Rhodomonas_salina.1